MRHASDRLLGIALALFALALPVVLGGCQTEVDDEDIARSRQPKVRAYFNFSGSRWNNSLDPEVDDMTVQMIDRAQSTIDFAIMGFSRDELVDALMRAWDRGVRLRFVGDARHMEGGTYGYMEVDRRNIPMMVGNQFNIMHNKFFIIDDRFVITGTGNITDTGYVRNNNNYIFIDSPDVAADFRDEFEQMFAGRFGYAKQVLDNGNNYQVGDTRLEVYFSPQEDAMGRILQGLREATHTIYFMIFAFTKDEVGSELIRRHLEFSQYNRCCDPALANVRAADPTLAQDCIPLQCEEPYRRKEVRGAIDRSQLHSNGPYHEIYRLMAFGVPMRLDGNDNSRLPGDYQAGGGRLHSKTMIIDHETDHPKVLTGSFNWSSSATIANDETFLVLHGEAVTNAHLEYFLSLWDTGKSLGEDYAGPDGTIEPGDVVFNEIHWDGWNGEVDNSDFGGDDVYNDEFIELLNTTDRPIDLSLWTIATDSDFVVGFYPGTVIGPHERFLVLDHNLEPYTDLDPQDRPHAFSGADFVMNTANDPRFLRLNLHNAAFRLRLLDPRGNVIDNVGDGGPPFTGGRQQVGEDQDGEPILINYSMERIHVPCAPEDAGCVPVGPGEDRDSWVACQAAQGGVNVNPPYRARIIATPGETNSINRDSTSMPDPGEAFRSP